MIKRLLAFMPCYRTVLVPVLLLTLTACQKSPLEHADFVATIPALQYILQEIVGESARVACILPPGSSPHTYELRPSTARLLESAKGVFYVDDSIDGWAARLAPGRIYPMFRLVPESLRRAFQGNHHHGENADEGETHPVNAHFWSDPVAVRAIVPGLVEILTRLDPAHGSDFARNADRFMNQLDALDQEFKSAPVPRDGYALVAFHPSWCYFFERYGIKVSAYVEPFPGKEPTPQTIQELKAVLAGANRRVVLSEVQLPAKSAEVLAESVGASVVVIDPLGGQGERTSYAALLRYNARRVEEMIN